MSVITSSRVPFVLLGLVASCGGSQSNSNASAAPPPHVAERPREADTDPSGGGGIHIEGQLGYLSGSQLSGVLTPATPQLAACFNDRLSSCSYLGGRVELKIRIGADGTPLWVVPLHSSVGDRAVERCMVDRAMALHFPTPRGGETETTYPLEFSAGDDARPAVEWPADRLAHVVSQHRPALQRCLQGVSTPVTITLYAAPHGAVATAGASIPDQAAVGPVDCALHEISGWHLPDPGSWYARTSITLP